MLILYPTITALARSIGKDRRTAARMPTILVQDPGGRKLGYIDPKQLTAHLCSK